MPEVIDAILLNMKIINFLTFIVFNRLFSSGSAPVAELETIQNNHNHLLELTNQNWQDFNNKSLLGSEIPTQIAIVKNNTVLYRWSQIVATKQKLGNYQFSDYVARSKALLQVAKISYEQKMVNAFIARLNSFNSLQQELNKGASRYVNRMIDIYSSFEMSEQQKQQFIATVQIKINPTARLNFQVSQRFDRGIELCDRGYRIFGNLDHYIIELKT